MFTKYDFFPFRSGFMLLLNFMYQNGCVPHIHVAIHISPIVNGENIKPSTAMAKAKKKKEKRREEEAEYYVWMEKIIKRTECNNKRIWSVLSR